MDMQKDVHLSADDLLQMVNLKTGVVGSYTIMPGPLERLEAIVARLESPVENMTYMDYRMHTGSFNGIKVTALNGGLYSPSSAIMGELVCAAGTEHIIRTGSCGALREDICVGDLVIVTGSVRGEGTTPYYVPNNFSTVSDVRVACALQQAAEKRGVRCHLGTVWTTDALLKETKERVEKMRDLQVKAVDMVSASLLTVAQLYGVKACSILAVSDNLITGEIGFIDPRYHETEMAMIDVALETIRILDGP